MSTSEKKPTVLIVGGGMGGLMLGLFLEKSNIPYMIFERTATIKPLGSAMSIFPTLLPILQQLGIYDECLSIGKHMTHVNLYKELKPFPPTDYSPIEGFTGYNQHIVARPTLYNLLLKHVPAEKILFGRRVLNISEEEDRVFVHLSDNSTFEGDIIVGADGAYSAVRQRMFEQLKAKGQLPKSDQEELPFSCTCLVGQTKPLDPKEFPIVGLPRCSFRTYFGGDDKPYTWSTITTAQNTIAFIVMHHLSSQTSKAAMEQRFRHVENAEWGPHTAEAMCNEVRDFSIVLEEGKKHTLGDLFDNTPKELISKVMLEEKVFKTWYSGRYVLLGDACHKLHPVGGQGAVTAIHDALALANLLYAMPATTTKEITDIFKEYYEERHPAVTETFINSHRMSKAAEKGILGAISLYIVNHMPFWLWKITLAKTVRFRPQIGFLEPIKVMGTVIPVPSPSELKARAVFEKQRQATKSV